MQDNEPHDELALEPAPSGHSDSFVTDLLGERAPDSGPDPDSATGPSSATGPGPATASESFVGSRSRPPWLGRRALVGSLATLLAALAVTGFVLGPTVWQVVREGNAALTPPRQLADMSIAQNDKVTDTVEYMRTAVGARVALKQTVGAVYVGPGGDGRAVIFVGGTGVLWSPERNLDRLFTLVSDDEGSVDGVRAQQSGPLGGVLKCGTTNTGGAPMAVCGWADHGCVAIALFPGRTIEESASLMLELRGNAQRRG
jgi:hypothetical protein